MHGLCLKCMCLMSMKHLFEKHSISAFLWEFCHSKYHDIQSMLWLHRSSQKWKWKEMKCKICISILWASVYNCGQTLQTC